MHQFHNVDITGPVLFRIVFSAVLTRPPSISIRLPVVKWAPHSTKSCRYLSLPIDATFWSEELVGVQHNRFTVTGDILWTPVEVQSSNSLLDPPPDGAITMVVRCSATTCQG
jgi:hypothetical protein